MNKYRWTFLITTIIIFIVLYPLIAQASMITNPVIMKSANKIVEDVEKTAVENFLEQDEVSVIETEIKDILYSDFIKNLNMSEVEADKIYNISMEIILKNFFGGHYGKLCDQLLFDGRLKRRTL